MKSVRYAKTCFILIHLGLVNNRNICVVQLKVTKFLPKFLQFKYSIFLNFQEDYRNIKKTKN
jgi:hypothetical protein